ncbi:MAG: apolipoprotein N-acyltransferase, partial [Treponemataceae bacterium]|nr:apolipoprotein N-acyltransferase [Treponemataceae bacterium]
FERGVEQGIYRKIHLVPFTEHFPYKKQLPWVYEALRNADTHFWKKGTEYTVFESRGLRFATPICFEDTFGYFSREFVRRGAEIIVNLTNDAWAHSLACQMQHATMAVFRAIENRRSVVRATASGQTCAIDPNGKITAMAEPFTETYLIAAVPLVSEATLYTAWGDWVAYLFVGAALGGLLLGLAREGHRFLTSSFRRRKIES